MKENFTAKTIEEAKQMAADKFGVSMDYIVFRIIEEPKKGGFLGIGKREAVVEAFYEAEEVHSAAAKEESVSASQPEKKDDAHVAEVSVSEKTEEVLTNVEKTHDITRGMESEPVEEVLTDETMTPNLLRAKKYISDIYREMGIEVEITTMRTENGVRMELSSQSKSGTIIGRRGETLDSIQYLSSILVNKDNEEYCRLLLDSNGYREKRRKTLEQLAEKIARGVLRTGRSNTLEPMNPYERRIIHSRISEIEGVSSRSIGEDPYRKVIVSSDNPRRGGNRGRSGQNHGGKRPYRERQPEEFKRKNLDSMKTSFERDYKKPKPEDELNAGLYGKIEF